MTKPNDIPQAIWDSAKIGVEYHAKRQELIARAIMAERASSEREIYLLKNQVANLRDHVKDYEITRQKMAKDWCDFCEAIGVEVDTHEAVAAAIRAMFDP